MQLGKLHSQSYNQTRVTNMDSWLSGLGSRLAAVSSRVQILARACWWGPKKVDIAAHVYLNIFTTVTNHLTSLWDLSVRFSEQVCKSYPNYALYNGMKANIEKKGRSLNRGCYVHTNPLEPRRHILWLRPARFSQKASPPLNQTSRANSVLQRVSNLWTL